MNLDSQDIRKEDIEELRSLLAPYDQKIHLPDSLKGENLLKLLPEEEIKPEKTWITWLLSSSGASILSAAAILVLAVIVVPRVLTVTRNQDENAPIQALQAPEAAYTESVELEASDVAPAASAPDYGADEAGVKAYKGEDLSGYNQDITAWTDGEEELSGGAEQGTGFVGGQKASLDKEAVASEASLLNDGGLPPAASAGAFSTRAEGAASSPASSPANSTAVFTGDEIYVTTNGQYNIYVRPLAEDATQFPDSTQALLVKDRQDKLVAQLGLMDIDRVYYGAASANNLVLIGGAETGTLAQVYSGLSTLPLQLQTSTPLLGVYLEGRVTADYLYCLSTLESGDQVATMDQVALEGGQGEGVLVVTSIHLSGGTKKETAIVGLDAHASFVLGDKTLTMSYTQKDDKRAKQEFKIEKGSLAQE